MLQDYCPTYTQHCNIINIQDFTLELLTTCNKSVSVYEVGAPPPFAVTPTVIGSVQGIV